MAGMRGFEPLNGGTKTRCLTAWRHPNKMQKFTLHNLNGIGKLNFLKKINFFHLFSENVYISKYEKKLAFAVELLPACTRFYA